MAAPEHVAITHGLIWETNIGSTSSNVGWIAIASSENNQLLESLSELNHIVVTTMVKHDQGSLHP